MKKPLDTQLGLPFQSHSKTSKEAAVAIEGSAGTLRHQVWGFLVGRGDAGATDEEIQNMLELNPSTQRPRRIELVNGGLVRDSGRTRLTQSRRKATVWEIVAKQEEAA